MKFKDADGSYLLEKIRDTAGQVSSFIIDPDKEIL